MICEGFKLLAVTAAYLTGAGLWTFVIIWMATNVIRHLFLFTAGPLLCLYRRHVRHWWKARVDGWRPFVAFNCWSSLAGTLDIPVKQLDVFIISSVLSLEAVGIYRVFKDVAQVVTKVADPIYQAIYPQFAVLIAQSDARRAAKMAVKLGVILMVFGAPVVLAISLTSPWWLRVIFGQVFATQWLVLTAYLAYQTVSLAFQGLHPLFVAMGYIRKNFLHSGAGQWQLSAVRLALRRRLGTHRDRSGTGCTVFHCCVPEDFLSPARASRNTLARRSGWLMAFVLPPYRHPDFSRAPLIDAPSVVFRPVLQAGRGA